MSKVTTKIHIKTPFIRAERGEWTFEIAKEELKKLINEIGNSCSLKANHNNTTDLHNKGLTNDEITLLEQSKALLEENEAALASHKILYTHVNEELVAKIAKYKNNIKMFEKNKE